MTCPVCADDEEIMVRRIGGGLTPLACPACIGMLPLEKHAAPMSFEDAADACARAGVEPRILTRIDPLAVFDCLDGSERPNWQILGMANPSGVTIEEIPTGIAGVPFADFPAYYPQTK